MSYEDEPQWSRLLVGVPGEDVGASADAGWVHNLAVADDKRPVATFGDSSGREPGARYGSVFAQSS